jgi:hypothetical protein
MMMMLLMMMLLMMMLLIMMLLMMMLMLMLMMMLIYLLSHLFLRYSRRLCYWLHITHYKQLEICVPINIGHLY